MKQLPLSFVLILLVWGLSLPNVSHAQKQQEPSRAKKPSNPSSEPNRPAIHSDPQQEQRGTEDTPLFIQITPSPRTEQEAADAKRIADEKTAERRHEEIITATYRGIYASSAQALGLLITITVMIWTTIRQLRAYVHVESALIDQGSIIEGFPEAIIVIKNAGKTPAYSLTYSASFALNVTFPEGHIDTLGPGKGVQVVVGPGSTAPLTVREKRRLSSEDADKVLAGRMKLFVYGQIRYRDAFRNNRITRFRLMTSSQDFSVTLTHCMEGNDAD